MQAMENTQLGTGDMYTEYARKGLLDEITRQILMAVMVRSKQK